MKKPFFLSGIILSIVLFSILFISCSEDSTGPEQSKPYSDIIKEVVQEINFARTKPIQYATILEEAMKNFDGLIYNDPYGKTITTKEGAPAFDEAIKYLKASAVLPALNEVTAISKSAQDHAEYQGVNGLTGHLGKDDSSPADRMKVYGTFAAPAGMSENLIYSPSDNARSLVIAWIVDDGVPDRGHRINMYDKDMTQFGVGFAEHKTYGYVCVVDFAYGYVPNLP